MGHQVKFREASLQLTGEQINSQREPISVRVPVGVAVWRTGAQLLKQPDTEKSQHCPVKRVTRRLLLFLSLRIRKGNRRASKQVWEKFRRRGEADWVSHHSLS
jgi:hypothetical protein